MSRNKKESNLLESVKESNPKDLIGVSKTPFTTMSMPVFAEVGVGMLEGALKYGRHNYRSMGVRTSVYIDAAFRHIISYWEGEDIDPDSGISHISKAIASLMVLRDAEIRNKVYDDRPTGTSGFLIELNKKVKELLEKYPDPKAPFLAERPPDQYQNPELKIKMETVSIDINSPIDRWSEK